MALLISAGICRATPTGGWVHIGSLHVSHPPGITGLVVACSAHGSNGSKREGLPSELRPMAVFLLFPPLIAQTKWGQVENRRCLLQGKEGSGWASKPWEILLQVGWLQKVKWITFSVIDISVSDIYTIWERINRCQIFVCICASWGQQWRVKAFVYHFP